jgi:hypothetical protein
MSNYQSDGWADNPFTFMTSRDVPIIDVSPTPMKPLLRDLFEKIKAKYLRMPPAKINPLEPVATTQWSPEMGMTQTLVDRFAPNPAFIGLPLRRKDIETQVGTKGFNTHYNIMIDQSGSMRAPACHYEGDALHRGLVCRLATANLISQAKLNLDSFIVYSYNNTGKIVWPLPNGEPSYDYDAAVDFLTGDGIKQLWNPIEMEGKIDAWNPDTNNIVNALDAIVPDGDNNEASAFEIMIENTQKHDIGGSITVFITDGHNLKGPLEESSSVSGGKSFDNWFRSANPQNKVFYIILQDKGSESSMDRYCKGVEDALINIYGYPREIASKFVWKFPDSRMIDPETGELIEDLWDQMGWLFTEIGKIFAGISEEFEDVVEYFEEIGHDDPDD